MTTRVSRSSVRVASTSTTTTATAIPSGNSKLENDVKMKAICESANAYESFLNAYGKLISSAKTREATILHLIEHKCTKVYVPLLLSKPIYITGQVVEAIARLNQRLEGFTEDQKKAFFNYKYDRAGYYISIAIHSVKDHPERKKEDYTEFICTAMHYSKGAAEVIYQFADFTTFLDIFNCWIKEYSANGKMADNTTKSYWSIVPDVLPKYQEHVLEKLLSTVVLSPKYDLLEPWEEKDYFNIFNILPYFGYQSEDEYLAEEGEIIGYVESIAHLIRYLMDLKNVKMLQYLAKHFPLKNDSRFIEIIEDISRVEVFQNFNTHLFTQKLWQDAKLVKPFIQTYYKLEPNRQKNDTFLDIMSKETAIGEDAKKFVDKLFPLHRMAIMNRSKRFLQEEWNSNSEAYGKMLNTVDHFGLTPIAYAILFQNIEAIKFFTTTSPSFNNIQKVGKKKIDYSVSISVLKDGFTIEDLIKVYANDDIGKFFETKKEIQARWKTNIIKGYHQTNKDVAAIIEHTPRNEFWFLAGSKGMFGPGIYFARTPLETQDKAHLYGIILEADVLLGNPLKITSHSERDVFVTNYNLDVDMLYYALLRNGYDSVVAIRDTRTSDELREARVGRFMQTGNEYMVYNTEQALFTRAIPAPPRSARMGGTKQSAHIALPPWLAAVQKGDLVALKKLPKGAYSAPWLLNSTPLMVACARGHVDMVKWLIEEAGAAINAKDSMNRNALFYAMRGGSKEIVQYLITKGVHLLEKDANGKYAVEYFNVRPLDKEIDLHKASAPKRVSVSGGYRDVLLKELVRMGAPAMDAVFRFYKNTMRPMTDDIKEKFMAYFGVRAPTRTRTAVPEPWMGATPLRKELAAYGGGRKRSGKK